MTADEFNLALKSLGLRQQKFAEALGVHRSTVNHWSRGKAAVPQYAVLCLSLMQKLADSTLRYQCEKLDTISKALKIALRSLTDATS